MTAESIVIRLMTEADRPGVSNLLSESFLREGPIAKSVQFDIPRETSHWVDKQLTECSNNGLSLVAVDTTNNLIIGCRLSTVVRKNSNDVKTVLTVPENPDHYKTYLVGKFLNRLYENVDIYDKYNIDEYVHFRILNVRKEYGQRGIAGRLLNEAIKIGRDSGYRLFVVEVTGNYSIRLYEKLEYDVLGEVKYAEYTDEAGRPVFGDLGVHKSARIVAKLYA